MATSDSTIEISPADLADARKGIPSDEMHCAIGRARGVIELLSTQFDDENSLSVNSETISNALWSVHNDLESLSSLVSLARGRESILNHPLQEVVEA